MSKIKKILDTLELINYIDKYRGKTIVLVVTGKNYIRDIIPDIIILHRFNIKIVIVMGINTDQKSMKKYSQEYFDIILEISSLLKRNNLSPLPSFGTEIYAKEEIDGTIEFDGIDKKTLNYALEENKIPILSSFAMDKRGRYLRLGKKKTTLELAKALKASIVFWISEEGEVKIDNKKYQFLYYEEIKEQLKNKNNELYPQKILEYGISLMDNGIKKFALIKGETGNIYTELLTYDISGTLISRVEDEGVKKADLDDIPEIYMLIKNEMERKNILPVTEEEIEEEIDRYIVYKMDEGVVAAGKLNYYEEMAEIAKIATYPRYQGGKKAKVVCEELIKKAKDEGYKKVFGLSINNAMINLFLGLGFENVERTELPEKWKENYDFNRKSKAFIKGL